MRKHVLQLFLLLFVAAQAVALHHTGEYHTLPELAATQGEQSPTPHTPEHGDKNCTLYHFACQAFAAPQAVAIHHTPPPSLPPVAMWRAAHHVQPHLSWHSRAPPFFA